MEALLKRRSVRKYLDKKVPDELIKQILNAAWASPSAGNQQPWHFIVINKREILDQIPDVHPHSKMITGAPVAILVCADPTREKHKDFWVQDCSAASENILIAVESLGLGSVWLGVYPREGRVIGLRILLNIPEHIIPFSIMPIGYPDQKLPPAERYDETRVKYNSW